ncbi:LVIVD repeat-containing protein [Antribacter gilvus]|uniref:LVIVD repeat-containing protein n=1 Tax=Antribacter gilvus TaxID=2304675 RepID=UPI001F0CB56F|nr:hypothetical protein [Antribacter gilvus]
MRSGVAAGALSTALLVGSFAAAAPVYAEPGDTAGGSAAEVIAALDDSSVLPLLDQPGDVASDNIELLANIPKNGAFVPEGQYGSDLAFSGDYAFAGNYGGFTVYDISDPTAPVQALQVVCPGSQNDISVYKDILVLSTDSSRSDDSCESTTQSVTIKDSWEGVKIFDISDPLNPVYVSAVETACGSHTHTLAPTRDGQTLYAYVSSYSPSLAALDCQPPHDLISIVKIPVKDPAAAEVVAAPALFPDGGHPGGRNEQGFNTSATSGCHDITAFPEKDLAAGACMGDGIIMDISDREHPVVIDSVRDTTNFAFWHSATFNNDATKVVFTDELGGGGAATCNPTVGSTRGANGIYDIVDGELDFKSYYKISRTNTNTENCVAHNGSLIPVKGRDLMVQAWYQGGISVYDFTDSENPVELAWFDRGPLSTERLIVGGSWSAYYYNGYVFSNDIQKGFDVLEISDEVVPKQKPNMWNREFNPQMQEKFHS